MKNLLIMLVFYQKNDSGRLILSFRTELIHNFEYSLMLTLTYFSSYKFHFWQGLKKMIKNLGLEYYKFQENNIMNKRR